jgi:AbrB family looped-hinge helix DNA binding protein
MARSTITSKFQTTVPKELRERFGLKPKDRLLWRAVGDKMEVVAESDPLDRLAGCLKVGRGNVVEDLRRAREMRGREPW